MGRLPKRSFAAIFERSPLRSRAWSRKHVTKSQTYLRTHFLFTNHLLELCILSFTSISPFLLVYLKIAKCELISSFYRGNTSCVVPCYDTCQTMRGCKVNQYKYNNTVKNSPILDLAISATICCNLASITKSNFILRYLLRTTHASTSAFHSFRSRCAFIQAIAISMLIKDWNTSSFSPDALSVMDELLLVCKLNSDPPGLSKLLMLKAISVNCWTTRVTRSPRHLLTLQSVGLLSRKSIRHSPSFRCIRFMYSPTPYSYDKNKASSVVTPQEHSGSPLLLSFSLCCLISLFCLPLSFLIDGFMHWWYLRMHSTPSRSMMSESLRKDDNGSTFNGRDGDHTDTFCEWTVFSVIFRLCD